MQSPWLTVDDVHALHPDRDRTTVWRWFKGWAKRGFPLVEEHALPAGGRQLVVRRVELEAHLGLIPVAA